jgi:copper chaperone
MMHSVMKVRGMTCQHCVETVIETVAKVVGVKKVDVNLKQEEVMVEFDESQTQLDDIAVHIIDAGFEAIVI